MSDPTIQSRQAAAWNYKRFWTVINKISPSILISILALTISITSFYFQYFRENLALSTILTNVFLGDECVSIKDALHDDIPKSTLSCVSADIIFENEGNRSFVVTGGRFEFNGEMYGGGYHSSSSIKPLIINPGEKALVNLVQDVDLSAWIFDGIHPNCTVILGIDFDVIGNNRVMHIRRTLGGFNVKNKEFAGGYYSDLEEIDLLIPQTDFIAAHPVYYDAECPDESRPSS